MQGTLEIWHIGPGHSFTAATCFAAAFILLEDAEVYPPFSPRCVDLNFCEESKLPTVFVLFSRAEKCLKVSKVDPVLTSEKL